MGAANKIRDFMHVARALGRSPGEQARIFWRLTKNVRARVGLAHHEPERVYELETRLGTAVLRDNVGDITNLQGLWVEDEYRVRGAPIEDGVILDIGANIGLFANWAHRHHPRAAIYCFEPLPTNHAVIRRNCPSAVLAPIGLGAERATVRMQVDDYGSIASAIPTAWHSHGDTFTVMPLDAYAADHGIGDVAFMKIDVEGMELDVLQGGSATLARTARIAAETHGPERHAAMLARLREAGFQTEDYRDGATGMVFGHR